MSGLPPLVLLAIFIAAAAAIWVAGIQLSDQTDVLATRLHLGSALGGLILLALATNLPRDRHRRQRPLTYRVSRAAEAPRSRERAGRATARRATGAVLLPFSVLAYRL